MPTGDLKRAVIELNHLFPLDRWWRQKYNIPVGSPSHLDVSQIDIAFEFLEERLFEEHQANEKEQQRKAELLKQGEWLSQSEESIDEDFDKIVI